MASLPARQQPSQRRSSPEQSSNDQPQTPAQATPVRTRSVHSEDSQTLFLNSPKDESQQQQQQQTAGEQVPQPTQGGGTGGEVKKCWICFADSTEDTPETSPWRDPCPCALVAHEECLLDWIADMEAPNRIRSRSIHAPRIECPQCKNEIKLARPRNLVVEAVRAMERTTTQLVTPGALTLLVGTLYNESMLFGVHSIYAVFGSTDGVRILRPLLFNIVRTPVEFNGASARQIGIRGLRILLDHMVHWRLYVGIPLIGPMLVLSRTNMADSILPVLPVAFFATQMHSPEDVLEFGTWPPSASLAFAVLPYLRQAYNSAYKRLFGEKEKQWLREIQPRVGQGQNEGEGNDGAANQGVPLEDRYADNLFEVRIDGGIWEEWEDEEDIPDDQPAAQNAPQPPPQGQNQNQPPQQPPAQQDGQADPPPDIPDNRADAQPEQDAPAAQNQGQPQAQQPRPNAGQAAAGNNAANNNNNNNNNNNGGAERRLSFSPTAIAHSVLGALVFPSIAGISGELLKLALPRAWTTAPMDKYGFPLRAKGLLQEKWGRSLVGGCLFVLFKDAVMLYVKWKMAQMHRHRRVVDFEGKRNGQGEEARAG